MSPSPRILGERNFISLRPWEPIWDVRTRPGWVQSTVLDLLRQLRTLRLMSATLPSIDTVGIPPRCQLRVIFGDLEALCNAIEWIHNRNNMLGVTYGGPDDKGTLWIKFYKMWSDDQIWDHPLQFVIWIDSMRPSAVALQDSCHLVSEPRRSEIDP